MALADGVGFQYCKLALSALERGDLENARSRFEKVVTFAAEWGQGYDLLGFTLEQLEKREEAAAAYRKALTVDPYDAYAHHALRKLGEQPTGGPPVETQATFDTLVAGLKQMTEGQPTEAMRTVFDAARKSPGWVQVRNLLAYLYESHRTTKDALREVRAVLDLAPNDFYARNALTELEPTAKLPETPGRREKLRYPDWANDDSNAAFEQILVDLLNAERKKRGLNELVRDELLTKVAREHAAEMREKDFFAHESPTPGRRAPMDRYLLYAPRKPQTIAENIARRWGSRPSLDESNLRRTHTDLMNSPPHRENILREGVTHVGVGVASNKQGDYWVTQVFAKPR